MASVYWSTEEQECEPFVPMGVLNHSLHLETGFLGERTNRQPRYLGEHNAEVITFWD